MRSLPRGEPGVGLLASRAAFLTEHHYIHIARPDAYQSLPDHPHHITILQKTAAAQHKPRALRQPVAHHHMVAEALAQHYGCPARADYLGRYRGSHSQTTLHRQQRMLNAQRAFYLTKAALQQGVLQGQRVLLVDDLLTTGSTLHALCDLLEEAGVAEVHVFVAAVAIRAV